VRRGTPFCESARALEEPRYIGSVRWKNQGTSEASPPADLDLVRALKRQLSTHEMMDVDPSAKRVDLRVQVDRLQSELVDLHNRSSRAGGGSHRGTRSGADADVLETYHDQIRTGLS
jgi:hypothetical protein